MPALRKTENSEIKILQINQGSFTVGIIGTTPLIVHRYSDKARQQLLLPSLKKNAAEKAQTLKHEPYDEAKGCAYIITDEQAPTFFGFNVPSFKNAMASTAVDLPGSTKAAIGRLLRIAADYPGGLNPLWGTPYIHAAMVRNSDMNHTPDVRFRIIFPRWALKLTVRYISPNLKPNSVMNLLAASGVMAGVGDWRQQKGREDYGCYEVVEPDDHDLLEILRPAEREHQQAAFNNLQAFNSETQELLEWYDEELKRREQDKGTVAVRKSRKDQPEIWTNGADSVGGVPL